MTAFPIPPNEKERLTELFEYHILDSSVEEEFNDLVKVVAKVFSVPIAAINFLDARRQWVKAQTGTKICDLNTGRENSICNYTILQDNVLEVEDLLLDDRFKHLSGVKDGPMCRYYAGVPLITRNGYSIGALCIIDHHPRKLETEDQLMLKSFARSVISQLEMRLQNIELQNRNAMQMHLSSTLSHDIISPLTNVKMLLDMHNENDDKTATSEESKEVSQLLRKGVGNTIDMVNNMIQWGKLQLTGENGYSVFSLRELTSEAFAEMEAASTAKHNTLLNEMPPDLAVHGDAAGLRFVLRNLLTNACKFTNNGSITVGCEMADGQCKILVRDTGVGISPDTIASLNRKQKIVHTYGTNEEAGHGLGLGLVQEYLARHGKELCFESIENQGTVVSFVM